MKIALIGPGLKSIPPNGWGGVEALIWQYQLGLSALGHTVTIFNSQNLKEVARSVNGGGFDFVHLHYDEYIHYFRRHLNQPFCVTGHHGYILKQNRWPKGYHSIFVDFFNAPGIITTSMEIKNKFLNYNYSGNIYAIRVNVDVSSFKLNSVGQNKAICVGKIQPRKKQVFLAETLDNKVSLDFVGPMTDGFFPNGQTTKYLGPWTDQEKYQKLTDYSCLILLSDGEVSPLVVPEALAAGLGVVVSRSASANLDKKAFITILPDEVEDSVVIAQAINEQIKHNPALRPEIRKYAETNFDTSVVVRDYLRIIEDFIDKSKKHSVSYPDRTLIFPANVGRISYYLSLFWLFCSQIKFFRWVLNKKS